MLVAERRNQSGRSAGQIERRLNIRPLVTIPLIETPGDRRRRYMRVIAIILLIIVTIAAILFIVDRYYTPIDLLMRSFLDRTGLSGLVRGVV